MNDHLYAFNGCYSYTRFGSVTIIPTQNSSGAKILQVQDIFIILKECKPANSIHFYSKAEMTRDEDLNVELGRTPGIWGYSNCRNLFYPATSSRRNLLILSMRRRKRRRRRRLFIIIHTPSLFYGTKCP